MLAPGSLSCRSYALSEFFFKPPVAGSQKASLASLSPLLRPFRHLEGSLAWGPSLLFSVRHIEGPAWLGSFSVDQVRQTFDGPASPLFSCQCWHVGRERLWGWLHPLHVTQQYRLASMADWLSSTGISHHYLLPCNPSVCLSTANSSPCPEIAPQSPISSSHPLPLPGDQRSCPAYVWPRQGLSDSRSM